MNRGNAVEYMLGGTRMNMEQYIKIRRAISIEEVSYDYRTVTLFTIDELKDVQIQEVGENDGDWKANWLLIGQEDMCGDPIFIDLSKSDFPVFTAPHGEGRWDPELIASSFIGFTEALSEMERVSQNRRTPADFKNHPLSKIEWEQVLKQIRKSIGNATLEFWESWVGAQPDHHCRDCLRPVIAGQQRCIYCGGMPA